jgi:endo-alpha-N-acetylgalactosaminidase
MWGPFLYAGAGGGPGDGRTHIAPKNAPYTQAGWNGKLIDDVVDGNWSLKAHGEGFGMVYRTLPQTLRFAPNHTYRVTLKYEADYDGEYALMTPAGATKFAAAHTPTTFTTTFAANSDDNTWIGVQRVGSSGQGRTHDLMIDNIAVDDLGFTPEGKGRLPQEKISVAYADSEETVGEKAPATNVLDGKPDTFWHTQQSGTTAPMPHEIQLNLGKDRTVSCLFYLPRQDSAGGRIAKYEVYTSKDGTTWGDPVTTGTWTDKATEQYACFAPVTAHYIRLRALSAVDGNASASAAEINVGIIPPAPVFIPQSKMSVAYADSQETVGENAPATNVLDGNPDTFWHTKWSGTSDPMPHEIQLNLGGDNTVSCLYYLPRQSGSNGRIAKYEVYTSKDGTNWGDPVATGTWANTSAEQKACFTPVSAHYIRLRALSEVNGNPWTTAAEINVSLADD